MCGGPGARAGPGCPYPQGPVPVSGRLLDAGARDVAQAAAEGMAPSGRAWGGGAHRSTRQAIHPHPPPRLLALLQGWPPRVWAAEAQGAGRVWGRSPAQRNGEVEDGQHERTCVLGEQVADDGGGDGGVAGLTDAHQAPGQDQQPEVLQEGRRTWGSPSVPMPRPSPRGPGSPGSGQGLTPATAGCWPRLYRSTAAHVAQTGPSVSPLPPPRARPPPWALAPPPAGQPG